MQINPKKCGILFLSKNLKEKSIKEINLIPVVHSYKFLGITLTNNLKIDLHSNDLKKKNKNFQRVITILNHQ